MIKQFYSSPEYEKRLQEKYEFKVKRKQDEIDEVQRLTKKIQKFTARGHIFEENRVFIVQDGKIYYEEAKEDNICPTSLVKGGKTYILDSNFDYHIMEFTNKYTNYKVIFNPTGRYGPTCCYVSSINATPAILEAPNGEKLVVEDNSKYDICVG